MKLPDQGLDVGTEASCAKMFASEMCGRVADRAVQIFVGAGELSPLCRRRRNRYRHYQETT